MPLRFPRFRSRQVRALAVCCLLLAFSAMEKVRAQEVPRYAIQVMREGKRVLYFPLWREYLVGGKPIGFSPPVNLPASSQNEPRVSLIRMIVSTDGGNWTTKLSVVKDVRLIERREFSLARYTSRLNEVFKVNEATTVGVEPFELQIVAVEAEAARVPQLTNKTASLAVMHLSGTIAPEPYSLLLQNQSGKKAVGLEVNAYNGNQRTVLIWRKGLWLGILIEPGSTYELKVSSVTGRTTTPSSKTPGQPDKIEIATVVFLDGSYEGDPVYAALINNEIATCSVQLTRIIALLKNAEEQSGDEAMRLLSKGGLSLPEQFAASEISTVKEKFQMLNGRDWNTALIGAAQGLRTAKSTFQFDVNQFQQTGTNDPARIKTWVGKMSDKYERWLSDIHTWSVASR